MGVQTEDICQMPADGFALTVRVGREEDAVRVLGLALQLFDKLFLALDADVLGRIVMLDINSQLGSRQVTDMAHTGRYLVITAQIFTNGFRLGRRLHDHQFRHSFLPYLYINFSACP